MIRTHDIRFFVVDYSGDEVDILEVSESEFLEAKGSIRYERNTIRENGCAQVVLIKGLGE